MRPWGRATRLARSWRRISCGAGRSGRLCARHRRHRDKYQPGCCRMDAARGFGPNIGRAAARLALRPECCQISAGLLPDWRCAGIGRPGGTALPTPTLGRRARIADRAAGECHVESPHWCGRYSARSGTPKRRLAPHLRPGLAVGRPRYDAEARGSLVRVLSVPAAEFARPTAPAAEFARPTAAARPTAPAAESARPMAAPAEFAR